MRQLLVPHWSKKLHSVTAKLYEAPVCSRLLGMAVGVGRLGTYTPLINVESIERSVALEALGLVTAIAIDFQSLPPLPVEAEMSMTGESHAPTVLGAEIDTAGTRALRGRDNVTLTGEADCQEPHEVPTGQAA